MLATAFNMHIGTVYVAMVVGNGIPAVEDSRTHMV